MEGINHVDKLEIHNRASSKRNVYLCPESSIFTFLIMFF